MSKEIRMFRFEIRAENDEQHGDFITGRPIVFNARTDLGMWDEIIDAGALDETDLKDVRLLVNHNIDMIPLARSRNNNENSTMQMIVVEDGMDIRANLDTENNADAKSLYSAISRGDLDGMSFMFSVDGEKWEDLKSDHPVRHITKVSKVWEVSAVTFPAYEQTSIEARGLADALESGKAALENARREAEMQEQEQRAMEVAEMTTEELLEQRTETPEGETLTEIEAELENRKAVEAEKAEVRAAVAAGKGEVIKSIETEERKTMTDMEIRNTKEYIEAYAEYIKSENDAECRALLSENATNGTIPVPEFVYDIVKNAWEREGIMSRVRKSYLKGNLKVGFEISASGATVHNEGQEVAEETLVLGTVELIPKSIKKWVSISDEAMDLRGEEFLRYIYDELSYQIAHKAADELIRKIVACPTASTTTCVGVPVYTATAAALDVVAQAMGKLSDEAANPVIVMNKGSWAAFKAVQAAGNYGYDPFEGLPVLFNNSLPTVAAATAGVTWAIVGDFEQGALANFPAGDEITFKYDEMTLAHQDLVRIIGREFIGIEPVAPNAFVKIIH